MTYLPDQSSFQQPFTRERQARFLEMLALSGNVRACCRAVGIGPNTAYRWRRASADFARLWDAAMVSARAHAEQVLADRALNGIEEPVFYHGEEIARRRRYSDRLLLAHLARLDAKADDPALAGISVDFDAALAEFATSGECIAADDPVGSPAQAQDTSRPAPEHPWEDEALPIVERALLYIEAQEAMEEEELEDGRWEDMLEDGLENGPEDGSEDGEIDSRSDPPAFLP